MLIKLGILLTSFIYAGILPYVVKQTIQHLNFNTDEQTLSYLSNKNLYGKKYVTGYKRLLFLTAVLNYIFFWLLSKFYDLGDNERFMRQIDYTFAFITLLAFVPHNIRPYSLKNLTGSIQRLIHNFLAINVFLTLPALIIMFQTAILPTMYFFGVSGLIIAGIVIIITGVSILIKGVNGVTEIIFINGISIWSIYATIMTLIR